MRFVIEIDFEHPEIWAVDEKLMKDLLEGFLLAGRNRAGYENLFFYKEIRPLRRKEKKS